MGQTGSAETRNAASRGRAIAGWQRAVCQQTKVFLFFFFCLVNEDAVNRRKDDSHSPMSFARMRMNSIVERAFGRYPVLLFLPVRIRASLPHDSRSAASRPVGDSDCVLRSVCSGLHIQALDMHMAMWTPNLLTWEIVPGAFRLQ